MEQQLYYTPPPLKQFEELKAKAIELWNEVARTPNYAKEKVDAIKDMENIQDNFMHMVAMFDGGNQRKLAEKLSEETSRSVRERMVDGGNPEYLIFF